MPYDRVDTGPKRRKLLQTVDRIDGTDIVLIAAVVVCVLGLLFGSDSLFYLGVAAALATLPWTLWRQYAIFKSLEEDAEEQKRQFDENSRKRTKDR